MAQAVTVYRWDDPGAPQMSEAKPSEYIRIIKTCLCDGYGTKPALGWILEEYDPVAVKLAVSNDIATGASGGCLTIKLHPTRSDNAQGFMRIYASRAYLNSESTFKDGRIHHFAPHDIKNKNWVIIGTQHAFYFFATNTAANYQTYRDDYGPAMPIFFAGDFISAIPNDAGRFIALTESTTENDFRSQRYWQLDSLIRGTTGSVAHQREVIWPADGSDTSAWYGYRVRYDVGDFNGQYSRYTQSTIPNAITQCLPIEIMLQGKKWYELDANNVLFSESMTTPWYRGYLPGMMFPIQQGYLNAAYPQIRDINGQNHWLLRWNYWSINLWINMEQW